MATTRDLSKIFDKWFKSLPVYTDGLPARGSVAACLVVLERLKTNFRLDLDAHRALGQAQIQGLSPQAVKKVLEQYGEKRPFLGEGGRTNRGGPRDVQAMLDLLRTLQLDERGVEERNETLDAFQQFLVKKVREYHDRKRLEFDYDPALTTWSLVHDLFNKAETAGKAGPVAQYLVGAKLELRFPEITVPNALGSAPDVQTGRLGDFEIGDTAFHVTIAPGTSVYEKCKANIREGFRVYLLVPDKLVVGTRQNAEMTVPGKIAVESLESFIANNIEELAIFKKDKLIGGFRLLLQTYNRRVNEIELDKSLLIEIPRSLQ
ncbi:MAG: DUF4928 family protein [Phycisphaerae bacterium]